MVVNLFTVRIILKALGVVDYGIYNVVGGIVSMFSFLSVTMASASQRFFAFDLGQNNFTRLKQTFSLTFLTYIGLSLIILILCETIGVWFLNTQMNIPAERMSAANWVFQFSIFSFLLTIMNAPYMSVIIARERMAAYAYISIVEVLLKLLIVYLLLLFAFDKLKVYAVLMFVSSAIVTFLYRIYSIKQFAECKFSYYWDGKRLKEMLSFAGWNMIGSVSNILRSQGINILLNIFFNPAVNAARAIAYQINSALTNFTSNFYMAVKPQIVKSYSSGNINDMHNLIYGSSKFAFYLMMILSLPLLFKTEYILSLWLENVPEYATLFTRLIILNSLLEVFSQPLVSAVQAVGNLRKYQVTVSVIYLFNIPISYIALKIGYPPESTMIISLILVCISFIPRLAICKQVVGISIREYLYKVIFKVSLVLFISSISIYFIANYLTTSFLGLIYLIIIELFLVTAIIVLLGLSKGERLFLFNYIKHGKYKKIS